jgi:predicted signal transduction protein with EAL and GGDEF domain
VSASIGASLYPDNALRSEDLIKQADAAMYRAKDTGRKNAQFYDRAMHAHIIERMGIELDLRQAMSRSEFDLFYQPLVDLQTGRILSGEALIRWSHPSLGVLLPERFIPVAEEIGAIVQLTRWVLEQAAREVATIRKQSDPHFRLTVNVSALDLCQSDFDTNVRETLAFHGLDAGALDFEVTEDSIVNEQAVKTLASLRTGGARVVIDDFGMGYSSLGYVRNTPLDAIKIDRRFVADVAHNPQDRAVVRAIATLAQNLGVQIVAEGVETQAQRELLIASGVAIAQGFFFSRPVSAAQFAHMVRAQQHANAGGGDPRVVDFAKYRVEA